MDLKELALEAKKIVYGYLKQAAAHGEAAIRIEKWLEGYGDAGYTGFPLKDYGFKIGEVSISNPVIAAPLAGISDNTYRIFAKLFGCSLTFSEMITSCGVHYNHKKSLSLAKVTDPERPCAVQIFGSEPQIMAEAAGRLEEFADIIDINMGCSVPKILKSGSGSRLLKDISRAEKIIKAVAGSIDKPVTVKARLGWDNQSINIVDMAKAAEASGAKAISIHGRTARQGFSGKADYSYVRRAKEAVGIPVIASGDICSPIKAKEVIEYTGCDAVMAGRPAKGSMWIFMDMILGLLGFTGENSPSPEWRREFAGCYLKHMVLFKGEEKAVKEFRKYLSWIFKGVKGIGSIKKDFFAIKSYEDALKVLRRF